MRTRSLLVVAAGASAALLGASPVAAHPGPAPLDGVADGLVHPLGGIDHLLAFVAVGLVASLAPGRRARVWVPATFLAAMVLGVAAGAAGSPSPGGEVAVAATLVALGLAVAVPSIARGPLALVIVVLVGVLHGHVHGAVLPAGSGAVAALAGIVATTTALLAAGALTGIALRHRAALLGPLGAGLGATGLLLAAAA